MKISTYTVSYDRANLKQVCGFYLPTLLVFAGFVTYATIQAKTSIVCTSDFGHSMVCKICYE